MYMSMKLRVWTLIYVCLYVYINTFQMVEPIREYKALEEITNTDKI